MKYVPKKTNSKRTVIANDLHIPYEDKPAVNLLLGFIEEMNPCRIILNGDIADFYSISRFDKNPNRVFNLQGELNSVCDFFDKLKDVSPKSEILYIQGNHEDRLRKYLWSKGSELASLDCLDLTKLLRFNEFKIQYIEDGYWLGKLYVTHGSLIRKDAGATAKAEFVKNGCSGISGHSHRDAKFTVRNQGGHFAWWESYCLCDLNPEYIDGIANWTHGFAMVTLVDDRIFVEQIPIIHGRYIYGGKIYS